MDDPGQSHLLQPAEGGLGAALDDNINTYTQVSRYTALVPEHRHVTAPHMKRAYDLVINDGGGKPSNHKK